VDEVEEVWWRQQVRQALLEVVRKLPARLEQVIRLFYGLDACGPSSLAAIGRKNISCKSPIYTGFLTCPILEILFPNKWLKNRFQPSQRKIPGEISSMERLFTSDLPL